MNKLKVSDIQEHLRACITVVTLLFAIFSLDILSTWYGSPDLSGESNKWIARFKGGWPVLIFFLVLHLLSVLAFFSFFLYTFKFHQEERPKEVFIKNDTEKTAALNWRISYRDFLCIFSLLVSFLCLHEVVKYILEGLEAIIGNFSIGYFRRYAVPIPTDTNQQIFEIDTKGWLSDWALVRKVVYTFALSSPQEHLRIHDQISIASLFITVVIFVWYLKLKSKSIVWHSLYIINYKFAMGVTLLILFWNL